MAHIDFEKLDKLKKVLKLADAMTEEIVPSDKVGYFFKVTTFDGKEVSREYVKDETYVVPVGTYENPILFVKGMEVDAGSWYYVPGNKDIPVECIKNCECDSFYNEEFLDVIPGYVFEGYSEEEPEETVWEEDLSDV